MRARRPRSQEKSDLCRILLGLVFTLLGTSPALAADTIEPYDVGFTDFEAYVHRVDAGLDSARMLGEIAVGYGFTPGFSGIVGISWEGGAGIGGSPGLAATLFGTPVDTPHVDLDLYLGTGTAVDGSGTTDVVPGLELNLDLEPDLARAGAYLRVEWPISVHLPSSNAPETGTITGELAYLVGGYVTLGHRHQFLVELPAGVNLEHGLVREDVIPGEVAFGYNVHLSEHLEMICQVSLDWTSSTTGNLCGGAMVGAIVTR